MDKTAIKNFAITARKILINSAIEQAGFYGITKEKISDPIQKGADFEVYETISGVDNRIFGTDIKRRNNLVNAIKEHGFDQVMEETAYTWFNRIIAIRFMEVNNYLPSRVRVLSSETGSNTPDIISQYQSIELNLTSTELEKIQDAKINNNYDEAFRLLFIKQCNELNKILPGLFQKIDDYMELLLKLPYTSDGVIRLLVDTVAEDNFNVESEGQVEIIGWMYQYYNTELKDDTFAKLKKNIKITKERIPAATQLFTPDWIVRYMVENSVGRIWIEHLRSIKPEIDEKIIAEKFGWKYYLPEVEQEPEIARQLVCIRKTYENIKPIDIKCIDPCMGSGHILVAMFDVLMDIYLSEGYDEREAAFDIVENNLNGLDIDVRAYQLAYFAVMMKGLQYNRRFMNGRKNDEGERIMVTPRVFAIEESNRISKSYLKYYGTGMDELPRNKAVTQMTGLLDAMKDAKEYGSILNIDNYDWKLLRSFVSQSKFEGQITLDFVDAAQSVEVLERLIDIGEVLAGKYDAVVTNPPYMRASGMSNKLSTLAKSVYPDSKNDLFAIFIERCGTMTKTSGYQAMITQQSWMFLSGYERLRDKIREQDTINLLHLGAHAFEEIGGEVVQTVSFVMQKTCIPKRVGLYVRLVKEGTQSIKESVFLMGKNRYSASSELFLSIPGKRIVYWIGSNSLWNHNNISQYFISGGRNKTHNNDKYVREWWEIIPSKKWILYMNGGKYRKWYGNLQEVVDWSDTAKKEYASHGGLVDEKNVNSYGISWNGICGDLYGFRLKPIGVPFSSSSPTIVNNSDIAPWSTLAFLNTVVSHSILTALNPTLQLNVGEVLDTPLELPDEREAIERISEECVSMEKRDWDSFETSWDFVEHPLIRLSKNLWDITAIGASMQHYYGGHPKVSCPLELCYMLWQGECNERFKKLKENEEELNRIFIEIYGLQSELTSEVEEKDITVRKADLQRDIKGLVSYAVGCMFGRYSLSKEGLIYAGGEFDYSIYKSFPADQDAIIPLTDEAYFDDDILARFVEFIRILYGPETLEENLLYIADALGTKGSSSREKIRNYFLTDFFKDHCNMYSVTGSGKRPIYWLFDSGKQNGFKALIYMHRYTPDTVGLIRSDYLSKIQSSIENALKNAEYTIQTTSSAVDKAQAMKKQDKYIKQLAEIKAYYPALSHIALQRIAIDLDDGVKVNYAKFQGVEVIDENGKKQKIDLLAKI